MGVSPLQLVNLHRNRRYFVIKHMVLSIIFLEDKHKIVLHLSIFYEYQQLFQHRICFSIQPPYYSDPWPTVSRSTSFFLFMLFNQISEFWGAHVRPLYCACRSFDITISRILYHHLSQHTKSERTLVSSDDILNPLFLAESCCWWFQTTCAIECQGEQSLQLSPIPGCMGD